ncbi:polysialyltransferase family glycosyltransferase [Siminovitchia sp. FSL W7-1587]|uniref:polysialyltransferase family glycosyltransferase n=1 Tax=Siminovitchia sp. FSL W7-1587 TaxID=2954699 RepID=UPI0030D2B566
MNFYICSTPYHIFISLCHLYSDVRKGVFYLTTHDSNSEQLFVLLKERLNKLEKVEDVIIRKRSKLMERLLIEECKDRILFNRVKKHLNNNSTVFLFPWNPYSLYTISNYIYKKAKSVIFLEDGANLFLYPEPSKLNLFVKKYLYRISTDFYLDKRLKKIMVQYPERYPKHLFEKLEYLDLKPMFNHLNNMEKDLIIGVFLEEKKANMLLDFKQKDSIIILTQPLSEDGYITEKEKIMLYKDIIDTHKEYQIVIKKHPRERTVYGINEIIELDGSFPSEIFSMLDIGFKKAVGVCTSAISGINAEEKYNTDENFLQRGKNNDKAIYSNRK